MPPSLDLSRAAQGPSVGAAIYEMASQFRNRWRGLTWARATMRWKELTVTWEQREE